MTSRPSSRNEDIQDVVKNTQPYCTALPAGSTINQDGEAQSLRGGSGGGHGSSFLGGRTFYTPQPEQQHYQQAPFYPQQLPAQYGNVHLLAQGGGYRYGGSDFCRGTADGATDRPTVGGRPHLFSKAWQLLTDDDWVKRIVEQVFMTPFGSSPPTARPNSTTTYPISR